VLVVDLLVQQWASVVYAQSIVIWQYFLFSVDLCWEAGHAMLLERAQVTSTYSL
jgi:hypothetical protein